jgi:TRAP-type C4-dicarboxylate transport system substrate-binding protein
MLMVALFLTVVSTGAFVREFRAADTQNEDYPTVQALHHMGSLVEERTGGRHRIKVFHSRQFGEERETLEQIRAGAIDFNRTNVALIGTMVPAMNVLAMPFLFRSIEHQEKVLDGPIGDEILSGFEPYGFVGLASYDSGGQMLTGLTTRLIDGTENNWPSFVTTDHYKVERI